MSKVHDHYVTCKCGAQYSDPIEKCPACGLINPELASTLNAKPPTAKSKLSPEAPAEDPSAPTLNGADAPESGK